MSMTPYDDTELDPMEALFGTASTEDTETAPPALEAAPPAEDGTVEDALSEAEATGEAAAPPAAGDAAAGSLPDDAGPETERTLPEAGASSEEPPAEPEPPPRRRRASRKKAAEASAEPLEPEPDYEAGPLAGSKAEGEREAEGSGDTGIAGGDSGGGSAQATPVPSGDGEAAPPAVPEAAVVPRPRENRPAGGHAPLMALDLRQLDRDLSREEREEWNEIYASYRSKSLITGKIIGVDEHAFHVREKQTGALERRRLYCAVVISYRVKVLIPETEFWAPGEERPSHVLRNMTGAEIDYIILDVDREGGVAVASRRMGAAARRHRFDTARGGHSIGDRLTCRVLSVGPSRVPAGVRRPGYDPGLPGYELHQHPGPPGGLPARTGPGLRAHRL